MGLKSRKFVAYILSTLLIFIIQYTAMFVVMNENTNINIGIGAITSVTIAFFGINAVVKNINKKNKEK